MALDQHEIGVISHVGKVRKANEDSVLVGTEHNLWVVADGVGGGNFGEVASQLATQTIEKCIRQGDELETAIREAHTTIQEVGKKHREYDGMATTVVACQLSLTSNDSPQCQLNYAWIGDSRLYRIGKDSLTQLSIDHSMAEELAAKGEISDEEAKTHSCRHVLTQAVGVNGLGEIPSESESMDSGDGFLLCSDGLCGVLDDVEIYDAIKAADSAQDACDSMLKQVLQRGAPDNVSMILVFPSEIQVKRSTNVSESNKRERAEEPDPSAANESEHGVLKVKPQDVEVSSMQVEGNDPETYRLPCDKSKYRAHCAGRKPLLLIIIIAMILLLLVGMH